VAIVGDADEKPGEREVAQALLFRDSFEREGLVSAGRASMTEDVGQRLLGETIGLESRSLAQPSRLRVDVERDFDPQVGAPQCAMSARSISVSLSFGATRGARAATRRGE
jgi:hypothetical protein